SHWYIAASSLLTGLALCERERGGDMQALLRRLNRTAVSEYIGLAKVVEDPNASDLLVAFALTPQRDAGSTASTARPSLSPWDNCRARLLLPGQADLETLEQFSRSIGDETRVYRAEHSDRWRSSSSEQRVGRPLVTVDELRRQRNAVLIYANAPPAQIELRRW